MRFTLLTILLLAQTLQSAGYDLWIIAGQSNAQGWKGDARHYPAAADPETDRRIPFYHISPGIGGSGGRWTTLGPQPGRFDTGYFGPEITFARDLAAAGRRVAIFKFTLAGTSLDRHWQGPGDGGLYDDMLAELRRARHAFRRGGRDPRIGGLIWIQGESDARDPGAAARYGKNLARLLDHFRREVARDPGLPILLGIDGQHPDVIRRPIVLRAQKSLAARDGSITFVPMWGLPKADLSHLTPEGIARHGHRLADAVPEP